MGGRKVLLVDDEPDVLESLQDLLQSSPLGVEVETAPDGAAALRRLRGNGFVALVTDYRMPGMTGVDLAAAAHRLRPELPIVMITAFHSGDMEEEATQAGVDLLLRKPLDPESFISALGSEIGFA
ncbi:MAG TPA: response regulator [Candidatus Thermoplasmatota archaeon]|nr:response regulator [Candidatus Thermoplasmatota archaeon]